MLHGVAAARHEVQPAREFLSDRDIGNYLRKLFSEETAAIDELREMASGIRSRIIVPPKTDGFANDPSPEEATAIGAPASEDRTQAVPIDTGTEARTPNSAAQNGVSTKDETP